MSYTYKILCNRPEGEYKEKGSKFIGYGAHVANEEEVKLFIESVRKLHPKSRHCCYAYILGDHQETQVVNDDGEPSGTAGKPILNQILSAELTYCCVGVIRYFGGTKLGASGLVRAYKAGAEDALNNGAFIEKQLLQVVQLSYNYDLIGPVNSLINKLKCKVVKQQFEMSCVSEIAILPEQQSKLEEEAILIKGLKVELLDISAL